jgi:DNA-binding NarL/FixJ family response regulator
MTISENVNLELDSRHLVAEIITSDEGHRTILVRIVVVDDHEIVRRGVVSLLESQPGWKVVAEGDNGECAIHLVQEHRPDIVILDLAMTGSVDGLAAARDLMRIAPDTPILILTMHSNRELVREILRASARGYVMKSDAGRDLITAVETLMQGKLFFAATVSNMLRDGFLETPSSALAHHLLTRREVEIVKLLAGGNSNKEVATGLAISLRTADTHRANIMNKLQLHCIQDLVRYAMKNGLVGL